MLRNVHSQSKWQVQSRTANLSYPKTQCNWLGPHSDTPCSTEPRNERVERELLEQWPPSQIL
jgi:hypothetical protein